MMAPHPQRGTHTKGPTMRWLVEAADTKTGKDTEMTVEALTEADAERVAPAAGGAWRVALAGAGAVAAGSVLRLLAAMALVMNAAARGGQVRRDEGGGAVQLGMARVGVGSAQT